MQTATTSTITSLVLTKDTRDRGREEKLVAAMLLNGLAERAGIADRLALDLLPRERIDEYTATAWPSWTELLLGKRVAAGIPRDHKDDALETFSGVLLPGAFNPLHEGHLRMAEVAQEITGRRVDFEVSIENVDKPPLDFFEIQSRVDQFEPPQRCWLTRAPTFVEKSRIFPEACFVVGADTIVRIAEPRYYRGSIAARDAALAELRQQNCRFLVFPRMIKGEFLSLAELTLPAALAERCDAVSSDQFRMDISSTELRSGV